jgi:hypothetical protein
MLVSRKLFVMSAVGLMVAWTLCSVAQAQRGQRGGQRGGFGAGPMGGMRGGFGGGPLALLQRDDVQRELKMSGPQIEQVEEMVNETRESMQGQIQQFGNFRDMDDDERREMVEKMQENRQRQQDELREKAMGILNRNQQPRFAQLQFQFSLQWGDLMGALAAAGVELDDSDREKLREAQRDVEQELREKIAQLQKEANIEALSSVMDTSKVEQLMGDSFTFEEQGPGMFGRRGGGLRAGPGQRGADRPAARGARERDTQDRTDRRSRTRRRSDSE